MVFIYSIFFEIFFGKNFIYEFLSGVTANLLYLYLCLFELILFLFLFLSLNIEKFDEEIILSGVFGFLILLLFGF